MKKNKIVFLFVTLFLALGLTSCNFVTQLVCDHNYEVIETKSPTCEERGYEKNKCTKCEFVLTKYEKALGHDLKITEASATCTTSGSKTSKCSRCDYTITETVDSLGHNLVNEYEIKDGKSFVTHKCSRCEYEDTPTELSVSLGSTYGYDYLGTIDVVGESLQSFYNTLLEYCITFSNSTDDLESTTVNVNTGSGTVSQKYYVIGKPNPSSFGLTTAQAIAVWKSLILDNPGFYWLSNAILYNETGTMFYLTISEEYAKYSERLKLDESIYQMVLEVGGKIAPTMTEQQKIKVIHDYIIERTKYAYLADGVTASSATEHHNLTGVSYYKTGVCEAYAEAFSYLCTKFGLTSIVVTGIGKTNGSQGEHEWNYVKVGEAWYGIDLTWDDASNKLRYDYFCSGNNNIKSFLSDHLPDCHKVSKGLIGYTSVYTIDLGMKYIYELPQLAQIGLIV